MAFGITAGQAFAALAPTVIGSLMGGGSDAPQRGAEQQVQANNAAIAETRAARNQQRADLAPWMNSGGLANNELMRRLGLGGNGRTGGFTPKTEAQLRSEMAGQFTTSAGGGGGGYQNVYNPGTYDPESGNTYGNHYESKWMGDASPGSGSVDEAGLNAAARNAFNAQGAAREGELDPGFGSLLKKFDQNDLNSDLVYQNGLKFGLDTGVNQLNDRAASGGNYGSGAALKALTRFGNDYGTTKTEGAYSRNMGEKNQIFNFLSGPSQQGQSAAAGVGAAGLSAGGAIGGYMAGNGNSLSAGTIASGSAVNSQVGQATDAFRWNQMLNRNQGSSSYNPSTNGMGMDRYLSGNLGSGD